MGRTLLHRAARTRRAYHAGRRFMGGALDFAVLSLVRVIAAVIDQRRAAGVTAELGRVLLGVLSTGDPDEDHLAVAVRVMHFTPGGELFVRVGHQFSIRADEDPLTGR